MWLYVRIHRLLREGRLQLTRALENVFEVPRIQRPRVANAVVDGILTLHPAVRQVYPRHCSHQPGRRRQVLCRYRWLVGFPLGQELWTW